MARTKAVSLWLITVLVIPALFLAALELGLYLIGYGNSYNYFNKIEINGERYFQDNPVFGLQFFPAALNRTPLEYTFSEDRPENLIRVFVLGGSAARGFPDPDFGFGRLLEVMLTEALPGKRVEVINTAMTAINSHVVYEIAKSVPPGAADLAIILLGNNEVVGPFGPGTVFQGFSSSLKLIRVGQTLKRLRIAQGLMDIAGRLMPQKGDERPIWRGMEMFSDNQISLGDARLEGVYAHLQRNLEDTIDVLQKRGAHVLLSTVPINLQDFAPFASVHRQGLSEDKRILWRSHMNRAKQRLEKEDWSGAISEYVKAEVIDAEHAELQYQLGLAYSRIGDSDKANHYLKRAGDLDTLRFRADSRINDIIRTVGKSLSGNRLTFVDNELAFAQASYPRLPGRDLFLEHVHFNFRGNYLLATQFLPAILRSLNSTDVITRLSEKEIARRVGFPNNTTVLVMEKLIKMVGSPPFTNQVSRAEQEDYLSREYLQTKKDVGTVAGQILRYKNTLKEVGGDWRLRAELASLLVRTGDNEELINQLQLMLADNPHHYAGQLLMAAVLNKAGKYDQEIEHLRIALNHTRGNAKKIARVRVELGGAYYDAGDPNHARKLLEDVVQNHPQLIRIRLEAYEKLIQIEKQTGRRSDLGKYVAEVQQYAGSVLDGAQNKAWISERVATILTSAGLEGEAQQWADGAKRSSDSVARDALQ